MDPATPLRATLPPAAAGAVSIVRTLASAGYEALLAGGCVRDLLLGSVPQDYDVATSAPPDRICELLRPTRKVGAQFGVILVKKRGRWIEVATFRSDGPYLDGRRPVQVTLSDARHDALRRDFTVNGMFLDPLRMQVIDYVGGRSDLEARLLRAIGDPAARFSEDYLRMLRAVRFAARLDFEIEPATQAAIQERAPALAQVAAERVREELEKMLAHPTRQRAWRLLGDCGLRRHLWPGAEWSRREVERITTQLGQLSTDAPFELALAILLGERNPQEIERTGRQLTLSNEQRDTVLWLVGHQADLDDPAAPALAVLKRLLAHRAFPLLRAWAEVRYVDRSDGRARSATLAARLAAIPSDTIQPAPLITGDDLLQRGVAAGPVYKRVLDALYTEQLEERLVSREQALARLDELLRAAGACP